MYQSKPVVVQTSNFGGAQGTVFNDNQAGLSFTRGVTVPCVDLTRSDELPEHRSRSCD